MEEVRPGDYANIKNDLINATDEKIISDYLKNMIDNGGSWPHEHFVEDADVFNKNPSVVFHSDNPIFVIVKPRTESRRGCDSGCWRIMGRDKLIKDKDTGKLLGFKKILKFIGKTKPREYKRSWVMEEFTLPSKLNPKQDYVICKIQLLFQAEIGFLLAKHSSYSSHPLPATQFLPSYGVRLINQQVEARYYVHKIYVSDGNKWPSYVTNDVYCMHPSTLVDLRDKKFMCYGLCIFANRTVASGITDGCDSGCWRKRDYSYKLVDRRGTKTVGWKTVFTFCEKQKRRYMYRGEDVEVTWIMEEYRLAKEGKMDKVICVVKVKFSPNQGLLKVP
ncbi:hypothetical protein N665_0384s0002 [Sinapis alba]|nr:hypothetical protein N665_0384s0002 [Sinapis alba]